MAKGDRLPRLLRLIATIQNSPGLSAEELAVECGAGLRQLFRGLRVLDYAGVSVYHDNGYRFTDNYSLQNISFSLEEALSLLYGLKLMERQKALFPVKRGEGETVIVIAAKLARRAGEHRPQGGSGLGTGRRLFGEG